MFGFTDLQLEDRKLKEEVDPFWGFTPRKVMQLLGTEFGRDMLRNDVWIKRAELEVLQNQKQGRSTIVTDVRFENEAAWLRSRDDAVLLVIQSPDIIRDERYLHSSEAGITSAVTDIVIVNDKAEGLQALETKVRDVLTKIFLKGMPDEAVYS